MWTAGDAARAATCGDGRFSTIHTPYCSLFLLDLQRDKEELRSTL